MSATRARNIRQEYRDDVNDRSAEESASADSDLVLRTRSGDAEAFGELWRRHYRSGMTVARSITSSIDPDDLVQEAYARIYQAILKGGGPNGSFRAYLFTSIRNTAAAWGRARRETAIDELETVADPSSTDAAADEELDRGLTAQAFRSLPSRWQEVLWYSEIEGMKPAAIGSLLGMSAGAVSQLTFRAREGLREAWIQAHLRSVDDESECRWTIEHLGAYARGNLGVRAQQRADQHLQDCARCMIVAAEAKDVSSRLALVLLPLVLGVSGASAYLATLQGGGTPIVALAAMPSSVVEGAVVAGSGAVAATGSGGTPGSAGSGAAGSAAAGSTASGGATAVSSAGVISGIGALVGAGSAALVVAGVVAAAAVVPGMLTGSPATSQPSASDSEPSSISSEVVPDATMSIDDPKVIEIDEQRTPRVDPDPRADADEASPPQQEADVAAPPADDESEQELEPAPDPGDVTDPGGDDASPGDGEEEPGAEEPGDGEETEEPGDGTETDTEEPGDGTEEPGTGTEEPGTDPGTEEPGTDPAPAPVELSWGTATVILDSNSRTHIYVPVTGTPGSTVQVWLNRQSARSDQITLGPDGTGTADLRPNVVELISNTTVGFRYVTDDVAGEWTTTTLRSLLPPPWGSGTPAPEPPATETSDTTPPETAANEPAESSESGSNLVSTAPPSPASTDADADADAEAPTAEPDAATPDVPAPDESDGTDPASVDTAPAE